MTRQGRRAALGGLLAAVLAVSAGQGAGARSTEPSNAASIAALDRVRLAVEAPLAREAVARVAYAEAAGQGDSGLAGVVYTILNRVASGGWGASIAQVVNARSQFEPVMRAGGDWRALPPATPAQRARIDTILNLVLDGRLPDLTGGALYFQNPRIVAARAAAGAVAPTLVHFGGSAPSAVIGDHAFYARVGAGQSRAVVVPEPPTGRTIIIAGPPANDPAVTASSLGGRGLFVLSDGSVAQETAPRP